MTNPQDISALIARVEEVLEPFARFVADAPKWLKDDHPLTAGSAMARRPVTAGQFRAAAALLKALHSQTEGGDDAAK